MTNDRPTITTCNRIVTLLTITAACLCVPAVALAQSVGLPAPRLLTTMPMGGQVGTQVEVTTSG